MQAAIAIESIEGDSFDDGDTYNWRDYKRLLSGKTLKSEKAKDWPDPAGCLLPEEILTEHHHHYYGRPWLLGRYTFEHLLSCGLTPEHKVLDVGCGAGRSAFTSFAFWSQEIISALMHTRTVCGLSSLTSYF